MQNKTGLNEMDGEEVNFLPADFKLSNVDFVIKIQELKVQERENALFECVLTHPLPKITWMGKGSVLEDGEKYSISVSDHKLIHRLVIKDCKRQDKGIYSAVAGITSCSAWLVVEAKRDPSSGGKKIARKTALTVGARTDLEKVAREQQIKNQEAMERILASVKAKHKEGQPKVVKALTTSGRDGEISAAIGPGKSSRAFKDKPNATKASTPPESPGSGGEAEIKNSRGDGTGALNVSKRVTKPEVKLRAEEPKNNKHTKSGQVDFDKVTDTNEEGYSEDNEDFTGSGSNSRYIKHGQKTVHGEIGSGAKGVDVELNQIQTPTASQNEVTDFEGNKDSSGSVRCQRHKKKVQWKEHPSDTTEEGYSEDNEDFLGSANNSRYIKHGQETEHRDIDTNEEGYPEDSEDFTGSANNSRYMKHDQKTKHREIGSNGKTVDVELNQIQTLATSQNEVTDGNKDSSGHVRRQRHKKKVHWKEQTSGSFEHIENPPHKAKCLLPENCGSNTDPGELLSDNEASDSDENDDSTGQVKCSSGSKQSQQPQKAVNGEASGPEEHNECDETEDVTGSATHSRRKRQGPLIEDIVIDPGVHFICGLSDVSAIINETAELTCKLSSEECEGVWFRDGKKISPDDNFAITKDGAIHKLVIIRCEEEHSGKYRFEADGRKTEAMVNVKDPPRFYPDDLSAFTEPVTVKVGHNAIFKMHFVGHEPIKIQWYKEGEELQDDNNTKTEKCGSHSRLLLSRCQRKDTGEIKIKLKNEHGFIEAISQLIVLDKPTPPLGPAEVIESSALCIEFRWRPPKDDGGSPVINYIMERQQVGRNTWKKLGEIQGNPSYRDTDVDHGRKYCYRIQAVTAEGTSEMMETDEMQAGTLAFPGPPAPPKVVSAYDDCVNISWDSPSNRGGSRILGYILEKRKKGSNLWTVVNAMDELIKEKKYAVKDVVAGMEYEFRVTAINLSGAGEFSSPSEFVFARDPKKPPGKVTSLKVTETSYSHLVLTWTKPEDKPGIQDEAKGYFVEIRQADCIEWSRCNTTPIITTSFSVKGLKSMDTYWVRVIATNDGGESAPEELANYVLAMPSPVRPKFTNHKMKSFIVVRAGNSVRITVNFEASPRPDIMWLKDNVPVTKRVTISNSDGSSQLLIPSSERSDSGIYSILVKNLAGQETFSTEVRVTDDPKPPGLVELEENVPGTVTVIWEPSPDEKRDDRLHYTVSKLDSTKRTWTTVADRLFNNKFTVCNIMHGREYNFRVYAKNDMGVSAPSESPTWGMEKKKVCGECTDQKGLRFALCSDLRCAFEASHCTHRL
ncbi:immunoglobulin-like and fibronectin type III domain-containing protein 1 isoform X2 [Larimichthys crocea]|uniref:immunoglobulin-like and fibronectin type III domain-containing protein 1 isoform X2 n=1 Tax=Larimichthys crocea TaxID=215358 RepID=UPI000F5FC0F7|nr:immunoglobulin-like and fibronectin type III domain-containing protein 1 isoform X2 [Larimichthys crocea]